MCHTSIVIRLDQTGDVSTLSTSTHKLKFGLFALTLSCSASIQAQDIEQDGPDTQSCPADFYQLPIYPGASLCQVFAEQLPASLTYHAKAQQDEARAFFIQQLGEAEAEKSLKGRILLEYNGGSQIIVISKDGDGSQVDVLVKS